MISLMIKTKYWLSVLAISVVLIAGSLAVSPIAIADDDDDDDEDDDDVGPAGPQVIVATSTNLKGSGDINCGSDKPFRVAYNMANAGNDERLTVTPSSGSSITYQFKVAGPDGFNGHTGVIYGDGTTVTSYQFQQTDVLGTNFLDAIVSIETSAGAAAFCS